MGETKSKSRMTLYKQIVIYFVKVVAFTLVTALTLMLASYFIYHKAAGFQSFEFKSIETIEIMEYADANSDAIIRGEFKDELNKITDKFSLDYYIKDTENNILYNSAKEIKDSEQDSYFINLFREMFDYTVNSSMVEIPIFDRGAGKIARILTLTQSNSTFIILFILIDICIPIVCFITYTLIFSRSLGRTIKKPLDELMAAVEKIKKQDLGFSLVSPLENEIGDLIRAFEEMRANLKESLIREWQLEQDRRDMVAAITHDLRTPLAIIQGHIEVLQERQGIDNNKLDSYLGIMEQNILRAKKLIDDMNSLVEIDNSSFELHRSDEDIIGFINNKAEEIKILAVNKMIHIDTKISDSRKANNPVSIDSRRLSQVIDNIVGNSINFTPEKGNIVLKADIEDNSAYFTVYDSGPGFSETDLSLLYKKFYKGDHSRSKEKGHSGLGLYIAKSIIESFGGTIEASNTPEGGACIRFHIKY